MVSQDFLFTLWEEKADIIGKSSGWQGVRGTRPEGEPGLPKGPATRVRVEGTFPAPDAAEPAP